MFLKSFMNRNTYKMVIISGYRDYVFSFPLSGAILFSNFIGIRISFAKEPPWFSLSPSCGEWESYGQELEGEARSKEGFVCNGGNLLACI